MATALNDPSVNGVFGQLQSLFPYIQDSSSLRGYIGSQLDIGVHPDSIVGNISNNPTNTGEITGGAKAQATSQLAPTYLANQTANQLQGQQLTQNANDINTGADTVGTTLQKTAANSSGAYQARMSQLGMLGSNVTGQGLGNIATQLQKDVGTNETDRASRLASIAISRAGLANQQNLETTTYNNNLQDATNKLVSGGQNAYQTQQAAIQKQQQDLQMKALSIAEGLPAGMSVDLPGYGTITGIKQSSSRSSGGSSRGGGSGSGTSSKVLNTAFTHLNSAFKSLSSAQNFVPTQNATGARTMKMINNNEYSQAINQTMAGYGLDQNTAQQLVDKSLSANGWSNFDDLTPAQKNNVYAGKNPDGSARS